MPKKSGSILSKAEIKGTLLNSAHKILSMRHADLSRLDRGGHLRPHERQELADIASFLGRFDRFLGRPSYEKRPHKPSVPVEAARTLTRYDMVLSDGEVRVWFCAAHGEPNSENLRRYVFALDHAERPKGYVRLVDPKTQSTICQIRVGTPGDPGPMPEGTKLVEGAYPPWIGGRRNKTGRTG